MSMSWKSGVIVSADKTAYFDVFSHTHKYAVELQQPDGSIMTAYVCYDFKSYGIDWWQPALFSDSQTPSRDSRPNTMACIGDTVDIGWDYHWFVGRITAHGEPRGERIDSGVTASEQRRPDKQAQIDSLGESEYADAVKALLEDDQPHPPTDAAHAARSAR